MVSNMALTDNSNVSNDDELTEDQRNDAIADALSLLMGKGKRGRRNKTVHLADVVRHEGPGIQIPKTVSLGTAIEVLQRKKDEEEEFTNVSAVIPAFPYDGAYAMKKAMEKLFGFVVSKKCMCGRNHNSDIKIVVDAQGTTVTVPWGDFQVPNINGHLTTSYTWEGKRVVFRITGNIQGVSKANFDALVELTTHYAVNESIYKGKAFSVAFKDEDGDTNPIPDIKFMDVRSARKPIYSTRLEEQFENDVLAYVTHPDLVRPLNGGVLKRGVMLDGPYGTGKTLASEWMAKIGTEQVNPWTYILVTDPTDFVNAYHMASAYEPAIVFVEDLDKIAGTDRTTEVDKILNILDGVNTKHRDIITVFTTNHADQVTEAMYRPGRIDFRMRVTPPDAEAAVRIAIEYAKGKIEGSAADFTDAGEAMNGMIPPTIKEAVARAQIRAVRRTGSGDALINNTDLVNAARAIEDERQVDRVTEDEWTRVGKAVGAKVMMEVGKSLTLSTSSNGKAKPDHYAPTASPAR